MDRSTPNHDTTFDGSVPEFYDRHLVPLIFGPYAADLVARLDKLGSRSVLEVAAGSGVLTRAMTAGLDPAVSIVASDLNQPMLDYAQSVGTARPVTWRQADVMDLPFADRTFDAVVCQFGVMFFPDRPRAFREIRRVLRPGGVFLFNIWDRIENNEFADAVTRGVGELYPDDPPLFLARTPHGYHDEAVVQSDLHKGGFETPAQFEPMEARSRAASADVPAIAYCHGTPLRNEIESRDPASLDAATEAATAAVEARFGRKDLDSLIRAYVITTKGRDRG